MGILGDLDTSALGLRGYLRDKTNIEKSVVRFKATGIGGKGDILSGVLNVSHKLNPVARENAIQNADFLLRAAQILLLTEIPNSAMHVAAARDVISRETD